MSEVLTLTYGYTAKDLAAVRAYVQRVAPAIIARTYYDVDEDTFAATPSTMERHLRGMLDGLVRVAIEQGSPALAEHLRASVRKHGEPKLTAVTFRMVTEAATLAAAAPHASHSIGRWFRPRVASRLKGEGIATLGALIAFCNRRGGSWWRSIPRIGAGRAAVIVAWLRRHETQLRLRVDADVSDGNYARDPMVAADVVEVRPAGTYQVDAGGVGQSGSAPVRLTLTPLERMAVPHGLSGIDGENRSVAFCYIQARHDLEAARAYLNKYRDQPKTLRAYTKELERFLLWSVVVRGKALSSLVVDDCEAYKDFLKKPDPRFVGERFSRSSPRWRPFASENLSPESQRYATRALRAAFTWLVDVRYLAGNPWKAVNDPKIVQRETAMQIHRALPADLWRRLRDELDKRCGEDGDPKLGMQWRVVRAALLLMGDSGLRREEAADAQRGKLRVSIYGTLERPVWELTVIGKRQKERTVPVSIATLEALKAHWADRGRDFMAPIDLLNPSGPLLSPVTIPRTPASRAKHGAKHDQRINEGEQGYSADGINRLISRMLTIIVETMDDLSLDERVILGSVNAHAMRHTFGTQSVADEVPVDVVQKVLGHASLQTTSIYVQAEKKRVLEEVAGYYARRAESATTGKRDN
ncbi:site-specific integrase [Caballeronia sp. LjRoot29]|uniref:phage integrase family protein n=1 Tax=Caballeronia sp. LjRoot29 TaxID=3342315 RepID=UPI003ED00542